MVLSATKATTSMFFGPAASSPEIVAKQACDKPAGVASHVQDKGVSVKTYLLQKLQPGEDERALSEVITTAVSSGMAGGRRVRADQGKGVVAKLEEAMPSLMGTEEPTGWQVASMKATGEERKRSVG
ncbi:hypothetical protein AXF42_Ash017470 [Apostasia shenzhenica]|uniref:LTI65/LTI78 PGEED repeat domain-containing protein n=1 Tax=Apostasia shenzhenica TaxID=1088818 RepID=A0A2H9ZZ45_9ASPA|nr:hypothetical protein AXF42_Ash017470 [Apostasia shenzhenica]